MVDEIAGVDEHEEEVKKEVEAEKEVEMEKQADKEKDKEGDVEKETEREAEMEADDEAAIPKDATVKEAAEDTKTHFKLMESKLKVTELDLNINFNLKIAKAKENLGKKIDENSSRISNVEETLASLLKAQQEQNVTNKALIDFLVTNFL
ncbi:hypothetical protein Dimus_008084, partial [Dionaea muscipula]